MVNIASRVRSLSALTTVGLVVTLATVLFSVHSLLVERSPAAALVDLLIAASVLASARLRKTALLLGVAAFAAQLLLATGFTVTMVGLCVVYLFVGRNGSSAQRALGAASVVLIVSLALVTVYFEGAGPLGDVIELVRLPPSLVVTLGILLGAGIYLVPLLLGTLWQARRAVGQSARERHQAEADREVLRLQAAVQGERARLAREVHDTVGHALTIVIAQSRVIQRLADRDPRRATDAATTITAVASDALEEIRGVLAGRTAEEWLTRQDMLDLIGSAGLGDRIDARLDPGLPPLPPPAGRTAQRVVQELLTNALRHGEEGAPIRIRGTTERDHVVICVTNALPTRPHDGVTTGGTTGGSGLPGLRERLTTIGGTLAAGPAAGQWHSEARIPRSRPASGDEGSPTNEDDA
jgi:signal transduction histidine kinase